MAHTPYTGKTVGALATWNALAIPGWRRIVIEETAGPVPANLDKTTAADSAYQYAEDPLGNRGQPKVTITIEGLISKVDFADTGLSSHAMDDAHAFHYQPGVGAGKDEFTVTPYLKRLSRPAEIRTIVPYTMVLELESATPGTWAASAA